jgi:hypothetical protein
MKAEIRQNILQELIMKAERMTLDFEGEQFRTDGAIQYK